MKHRPFLRTALLLMVLSFMTSVGCKKKDTTKEKNLLTGAEFYTGVYPEAAEVTYTVGASPVKLTAVRGQYVVFFKDLTPESEAVSFITSKGGTVIAKVPLLGYYLAEAPGKTATEFINSIKSNMLVEDALPNVISFPKSNALVLDDCNRDHGIDVKASLQQCGGTIEGCVDITRDTIIGGQLLTFSVFSKVHKGVLEHLNNSKSGPVLINISFNGGLPISDPYDYNLLSSNKQTEYNYSWLVNMKALLQTLVSIPEANRKNIVVTIAAGNENAPVDGFLNDLRANPQIAKVLKENVLITTTSLVSQQYPINKNYALDDPDVIVLNNANAVKGSSLAAPCALGYVQSIMREKGVTAAEALQAVKLASYLYSTREVKLGDALALVGAKRYVAYGGSIAENFVGADCEWNMLYAFDSVEIIWNGSRGVVRSSISFEADLVNGQNCSSDPLSKVLMAGPATGSDANITGQLKQVPLNGVLQLSFKGQKTNSSTITATVSSDVPELSKKLQLTLIAK